MSKPKKIWRLIVTVTDSPIDTEEYLDVDKIKSYVENSPEAGIWIKVVEAKDMGTL